MRKRCHFCNTEISPSSNPRIIEIHTKYCAMLCKMKTSVHLYHLQDNGLLSEEIDAFKSHGKHTPSPDRAKKAAARRVVRTLQVNK